MFETQTICGLTGLKHINEHVVQQLNLSSFPRASLYTGDILALSFNDLDSLVQIPLGCGEQNMIHFAPSIYVLRYLEKSTLDDREIRSRALGNMMEGKQPLHDSLESLTYSKSHSVLTVDIIIVICVN